MISGKGSLQRPTQPWTLRDHFVDALYGCDALGHHMDCLAEEGRGKPVGDVAVGLFIHQHGSLAHCLIEFQRPFQYMRRSLPAAGDLHQRDQMGGIERMAYDQALRVPGLRLNVGRQHCRAATAHDYVRFDKRLQRSQCLPFDGQAFRHVLLHELGSGQFTA